MSPNHRTFGYLNGAGFDTPAQQRRRKHKWGHLAALERAGKDTTLSDKHNQPKGQDSGR
jgi:hypothetical protein